MPVMLLRLSDERCAATDSGCLDAAACPSMSAEECTAHQDSLLLSCLAFKRAAEGLVVIRKETSTMGKIKQNDSPD